MAGLEIIFLGSGCSAGVPSVPCLTRPEGPCPACRDSRLPGSRNRRLPVSLLVRHRDPAGELATTVIDAGKSFYQASVNLFAEHRIDRIDAVLLTHSHFDAIAGMDDLRAWTLNSGRPIPVYLRESDMGVVGDMFRYLVEGTTHGGTVANLQFTPIANDGVTIAGLRFDAVEVEHGVNYTANGYRFGDVCYISDASRLPPAALRMARGCRLLILDAIFKNRTTPTHLSLEQAVEYVEEVKPKRALFVGMSHRLEHTAAERELRQRSRELGIEMGLAHDGLQLTL